MYLTACHNHKLLSSWKVFFLKFEAYWLQWRIGWTLILLTWCAWRDSYYTQTVKILQQFIFRFFLSSKSNWMHLLWSWPWWNCPNVTTFHFYHRILNIDWKSHWLKRAQREILCYVLVIMVDFTGIRWLVCRNICSAVGGAISVMFYWPKKPTDLVEANCPHNPANFHPWSPR